MSDKQMFIEVRGKQHSWTFSFYGDPSHIEDWRADGLAVFVVESTIPASAVDLGLARAWVFVQKIFNFRSPF